MRALIEELLDGFGGRAAVCARNLATGAELAVGHVDIGPPYRDGLGPAPRWGGSPEEANEARADSWATVLGFLHEHLGATA